MKMDNVKEIVLRNVVNEFEYMANNIASHANVHNDNVYPQPCTYLTTHYICMKAAGFADIDYDVLVAVSGSSALFAYEPNEFMPKYSNLHIGISQRIEHATGFGWERLSANSPTEYFEIIKDSIKNSRPVKAVAYEHILFVGFHDEPENRKVYILSDGADYFVGWANWIMFCQWFNEWSHIKPGRHSGRVAPQSEKQTALQVLQDLSSWAIAPPEAVKNQYPHAKFGLEGIETYANDCGNVRKYKDWKACHDINPQWVTRNSSAVYLKYLVEKDLFSSEMNEYLLAASSYYKKTYNSWKEFYRILGHGAPKNAGKDRNNRIAGTNFIKEALEHEKQALTCVNNALKALSANETK
jgi:hypothetical protein